MPISREEFEEGHLDIGIPILQILEANPEYAFSVEQIRDRLLQVVERHATEAEVAIRLDGLVEGGTVETEQIRGSR